jgi:DNA-binding transcriptional MerR regulator/methylmalonyl-CoA mutase cobalamin-binding subunit
MRPIRTITLVAKQTGLSVHTIRVWEKRHGAVRPVRASNKRRLYTDEEVERLRLLRQATMAGHTIGQIARASAAELRRLLRQDLTTRNTDPAAGARQERSVADDLIAAALRATERLDSNDLRDLLDRAAVELGSPAMLHKFVGPFAEQVGERWRAGDLNVAHEHFATSNITGFLANFARPYPTGNTAHHLVLATPSGQLHELGAIIAAAAARSHGWRATYLGSSLPMEELIGVARKLKPRAIGLSIVFPPDDDLLIADLAKLPKLLPPDCAVLVGGRSVQTYADVLKKIKATVVSSLEDLYPVLDTLQRARTPAAAKRAK